MLGRRSQSGRVAPGHIVNGVLAGVLVAAIGLSLFILPLWPMARDPRFGWLLVPVAALTTTHWALLHEAIHGLFHPSPAVNRLIGRILALAGGSSFRVLRFGHLMHHRFNRHRLDRPDCFDPAETSATAARARFYVELFGGFYLIEAVIPLLFLLPRPICVRILDRVYAHPDDTVQTVRALAHQSFIGDRQLRELRQDALLQIGIIALALFAWGPRWPLLLAFLAGRGFIISFLDNVYHYRTPIDQVTFAYNLRLPAVLRLLILNMNLHRVHHGEPNVPWWRLTRRFEEGGDCYDADYARTAISQLRGPASIADLASAKSALQDAT
jgi:fatty acid desaturase